MRRVKLNTTTVKNNDALLNRLKRLEGQMRGLQSMIAEDRYCIDVLVQITQYNHPKTSGFYSN